MTPYTQTKSSAAQSALRFYTGTARQGTSKTTAAAWGTAPAFPGAVCWLGLQIQTKEQAPVTRGWHLKFSLGLQSCFEESLKQEMATT